VEVNLFHRTPERAARVASALRRAGVLRVLGVRPSARIPGLPSDRAFVDQDGIRAADVCLVPLEDGDRTGALRALGKRVISVDLNPLSRTSRTAHLPIVDELTRALSHIADDLERPSRDAEGAALPGFNADRAVADALAAIDRRLRRAAGPRWPRGAPRR